MASRVAADERPRSHGLDAAQRGARGLLARAGGVLAATPPCVDLVTDATFRDFRLHAELRFPPGSNSGIYLRGRYEVQIQDDAGKALDPLRMGGVYGFIAPSVDAARAAGEWQTLDVELVGRRVTVVLNGTTIIEAQEIPGITGGALDSDEGAPGPIMLQGDHGADRVSEPDDRAGALTSPRYGDGSSDARYAARFKMSSARKLATTGAISGVHAPRRLPQLHVGELPRDVAWATAAQARDRWRAVEILAVADRARGDAFVAVARERLRRAQRSLSAHRR